MDVKTKILICVLPILGAAGIGFGLVMPAYEEFSLKAKAVDDKKTEHQDLQAKLADRAKIQREMKDLNASVDQLRAAVPKKPELEILNIDLEKMCNESGMDMISFTEPDVETLKKAGLITKEEAVGSNFTKGKAALTDRVNKTLATGTTAVAGATTAPKKLGAGADAGLAKITVQVKAIGDYAGAESLIRKLESYKRVVAISEIKTWVPKREDKGGKAKAELPDDTPPKDDDVQGDWKKLWVSFLLTAYYLP